MCRSHHEAASSTSCGSPSTPTTGILRATPAPGIWTFPAASSSLTVVVSTAPSADASRIAVPDTPTRTWLTPSMTTRSPIASTPRGLLTPAPS